MSLHQTSIIVNVEIFALGNLHISHALSRKFPQHTNNTITQV